MKAETRKSIPFTHNEWKAIREVQEAEGEGHLTLNAYVRMITVKHVNAAKAASK